MASVQLGERRPSVEEYCRLISAVGWKPRDAGGISRGLAASLFAICAETNGEGIGMGRVIGGGGPHYYLTDVVVVSAHPHRGLRSQIVSAPTKYLENNTFKNK